VPLALLKIERQQTILLRGTAALATGLADD
jgi:hypothetical protein